MVWKNGNNDSLVRYIREDFRCPNIKIFFVSKKGNKVNNEKYDLNKN